MITFAFGSLFTADETHSLAQCISGDTQFGMFRGISVQFIELYPELRDLRGQGDREVGTVVPVNLGGKFIYNLITKHRFWNKPTCASIYSSLRSMKYHAIEFKVSDIAMPFLGAGCDKMDFYNDVLPLVEDLFKDTSINIHIYSLQLNRFTTCLERFVVILEIMS